MSILTVAINKPLVVVPVRRTSRLFEQTGPGSKRIIFCSGAIRVENIASHVFFSFVHAQHSALGSKSFRPFVLTLKALLLLIPSPFSTMVDRFRRPRACPAWLSPSIPCISIWSILLLCVCLFASLNLGVFWCCFSSYPFPLTFFFS